MNKIEANQAIYHNIERKDGKWYFKFGEGVRYKKYVNEDGYELILDQNNKPVYDPVVVGTYNFFTYDSKLELANWGRHLQDIKLWKKYGTGPNDPTTREEREKIGGLILGVDIIVNYEEIQKEIRNQKKDSISYDDLMKLLEKIKKDQILEMIKTY